MPLPDEAKRQLREIWERAAKRKGFREVVRIGPNSYWRGRDGTTLLYGYTVKGDPKVTNLGRTEITDPGC